MKPQDILTGVFVALIWGMGFVFAKAAIGHFPPILLMAFRFLVTALALVWFVRPPVGHLRWLAAVAFISAAVQYSLTFSGLKGVDASTAVLVIQLEVPFLALLGALFLKERPGRKSWLGIAGAFVGVALIAGEPELSGSYWYLAMLVGGALTWSIGQAMIRHLGNAVGGFTLIAWVAVLATPQIFLMSFLFEDDHLAYIRAADWVVWGAVIYLGLVMTALGYALWYSLLARHPISKVGPFLLLLPVFAVIGSVTMLGERLTAQIAIGGLVGIASLAFIMIERPAKPAPEAAE